jgi:hypothetical protein
MDPDLLARAVNQFGTGGGLGRIWQEASRPFYFCPRIAFIPSLEEVTSMRIIRALPVCMLT